MKYSILGFNQKKVVEYQVDSNLRCDLIDLLLLNYIIYAQSNANMKHILDNENQPCVWLQHKHILEDLPILNITEGTLKNRISKLKKMKLIQSTTVANENMQGTRTYYRTTSFINDLLFETTSFINDLLEKPGHSKMTSYNKLTTDNKVKEDNKEICPQRLVKKESKKEQAVEYVYNLYKTICIDLPRVKVLSANRKKAILLLLKNYTVEDIEKCFTKANESNYLLGKVNGWKADFDWLLKEDKFIRVLEGRYDNFKDKSQLKEKAWEKNVKCEKYTAEEEVENKKWQEDMLKKGVQIDY